MGILGACTLKLGIPAMLNLYFLPYWFFVLWLDVVTYLHHHGSSNPEEKMPWFRGEVGGGGGGSLALMNLCAVAGHGDLPAPPWQLRPRGEDALVPWRGGWWWW